MRNSLRILGAVVAVLGAFVSSLASATVFDGTLHYTTFLGGQNVNKVTFNYDDSGAGTFNLGVATNIQSSPGADGIIFRPNGNLLVGGAGVGSVFEINPTSGATANTFSTNGQPAFHLTLDPSGTKTWTSNFGGPLVEVGFGGTSITHTVTGDEGGLTQIAFAPNGNVFYVNGSPNGGGNVGMGVIGATTFVTTRLFTGPISAHGLVYDPFSDRMILFGAGFVGSFKTDGTDLLQFDVPGIDDFDQGAVDGKGHAFIAGSNAFTLVDYLASGEITNASNRSFIKGGFAFIDDVAPLVGLGSQNPGVPEPGALSLVALTLGALLALRRRKV